MDRRGRKQCQLEEGQCIDAGLMILPQPHGEFWTYRNCVHGPNLYHGGSLNVGHMGGT